VYIDTINEDVYDVNMPYHHGNLREALIDAGLDTARAEGPDAVVLRAATRSAGVSPNAAYRHFADRDELLGAVARRCMEKLAELIEMRLAEGRAEDPSDPGTSDPGTSEGAWKALVIAGRAYIEFALTETGWFKTAFGSLVLGEDHDLPEVQDPYAILNRLLDDLVTAGALPIERRPGAEYAAWASVHGIATLLTEGPLVALGEDERRCAIDKAVGAVISGL
jgi:AcrR family transcriptional regulator